MRTALAVGALALLLCANAFAQPQPPRAAGGPNLFISPAGKPFRAGPGEPYPVGRWFAEADKNRDGRIDRAEFRADAEAFFHVLDQNHDGVIDSAEVARYEQEIVPEILGAYRGGYGGPAPGRGDGSAGPGRASGGGGRRGGSKHDDGGFDPLQGATPYELLNAPEPVLTADSQLDGRITLEEFLDAADRHFDLLDKAGRGFLTLSDLPQTPVQKRMNNRRGGADQGGPAH